MAKDPRFNFYVDNWIGGTEGFTLEQEGAYLALILMQTKVGRFTHQQAHDKLMQKTRGNAAACAELWNFLMPKFSTDGTTYWSDRLEAEINKSRLHSQKQSERAKKRFLNPQEKGGTHSGNAAAHAAVLPDNRTGIGIGSRNKTKGVQGETDKPDFTDYELWTAQVIDHTDALFEQMLMGEQLKPNGSLATLARSHLELLGRYSKTMQPQSQQTFRYSLLRHVKENLTETKKHRDKPTPNLAPETYGKL